MSGYYSLWVNKNLKEDFNVICEARGSSTSRAVRTFMVQYIKNGGKLPYDDMMNRIRKYSDEDKTKIGLRVSAELRNQFSAVCKANGDWLMSDVVRAFMDYCASNNCLPF